MVNGIMQEINTLTDKHDYYTAWRLIKSLPTHMSERVCSDVLRKMNTPTKTKETTQ